jgi:hypothetical protein
VCVADAEEVDALVSMIIVDNEALVLREAEVAKTED